MTKLVHRQWKREPKIIVCLKSLYKSENINEEFLKEIENQHKYGGKSAIVIYGLTKDPNHNNYMIVMQYARQGSLRQLLDKIRNGKRPEIRCEVPQLLLDLMENCYDANPQARPTAKELVDMLKKYRQDIANKEGELSAQIEKIKPAKLYYQKHKQAIYTCTHIKEQDEQDEQDGQDNSQNGVNLEYYD
ncbi:2178_t:CDS:2 [Scutellospora calospora]|uniref:2178_t:CDS:1 n=1 Tax=Scutellospora calospora TaxID=85575 RepID=A0ACA9JUJ1_9GLOM|nr:2178_t:CDS:2 [Scutellospora calospora]